MSCRTPIRRLSVMFVVVMRMVVARHIYRRNLVAAKKVVQPRVERADQEESPHDENERRVDEHHEGEGLGCHELAEVQAVELQGNNRYSRPIQRQTGTLSPTATMVQAP